MRRRHKKSRISKNRVQCSPAKCGITNFLRRKTKGMDKKNARNSSKLISP